MLRKKKNRLLQYSVVFHRKIKDFERLFVGTQNRYHAQYVRGKMRVNILLIKNRWIKDKKGNIKRVNVAYVEPFSKRDERGKWVLKWCKSTVRFLKSWKRHIGGTEANKAPRRSLSEHFEWWSKVKPFTSFSIYVAREVSETMELFPAWVVRWARHQQQNDSFPIKAELLEKYKQDSLQKITQACKEYLGYEITEEELLQMALDRYEWNPTKRAWVDRETS